MAPLSYEEEITKKEHRKEFVVPEKYEEFVFYDRMIEDIILVFANKGKKLLSRGKFFFGDGTFKSCPTIFEQIFTIHMDIGSTKEATCVLPVVYAFLSDKKQETNRNFFSILKTAVPDFKPSEIHVDFEKACINGFFNILPEAEIKCCNFHFNQALWRKAQEIGLVIEYTNIRVRNEHNFILRNRQKNIRYETINFHARYETSIDLIDIKKIRKTSSPVE